MDLKEECFLSFLGIKSNAEEIEVLDANDKILCPKYESSNRDGKEYFSRVNINAKCKLIKVVLSMKINLSMRVKIISMDFQKPREESKRYFTIGFNLSTSPSVNKKISQPVITMCHYLSSPIPKKEENKELITNEVIAALDLPKFIISNFHIKMHFKCKNSYS